MAKKNELAGTLDKLNTLALPKAQLKEVGEFAINLIVLRTRKGLDADRKPFKRYSSDSAYQPAYARKRRKRGLQTQYPDLALSGHMLGSLRPEVISGSEVIITTTPQEVPKIVGNEALGREFYDVRADAELEAIAEVIADDLVAEILK